MNAAGWLRQRDVHRLALGCTSSLVAFLLLVGCGGKASVPPPSPGEPLPTASWTDPARPDHSGWIKSLPPATNAAIVSARDAKHLVSMPWHFIGISTDGSTLDVAYLAGDDGCLKPVGFTVTRSGKDINVQALSKRVSGDEGCADVAVIKQAHLKLPGALTGSAHLVHSPIDPAYTGNVFN